MNTSINAAMGEFNNITGFIAAFDRVIGHEGEFTAHPHDRGNWTGGIVGKGLLKGTKFGISAMTYPDLDIQGLTVEEAKRIYKRDWWDKLGMAKYPKSLRYQLFDAAINHGTHNMAVILQAAVGAETDGVIGPITLGHVNSLDHNDLLMRFLACRLEFICQIGTFGVYGRGWVRRVAQNLRYAAEDN